MQNVTENRHKYIGGSDIPIIMGISPFKTRFELLLEKAEIKENDFKGNEYTDFGNELEPKIRDYVNQKHDRNFIEHKIIKDDIRYHADGFDEQEKELLEIKTTSQMHKDVGDYKTYLVQLLFGMKEYDIKTGVLAVYERPKNFNADFDEKRLQVFQINIDNFTDLLESIYSSVDSFREDLKKVKEDPFITEEELQPNELVRISNQIIQLESKLAMYKEIEKEAKALKTDLKKAMQEKGIKKWTTNNGVQITLVEDGKDKTVEEFDLERFTSENPDTVKKYMIEKIKKGRAGYVKITLPK